MTAGTQQPDEDGALRHCLEGIVVHRFGRRHVIAAIDRRRSAHSASYAAEVVTVRLASGEELKLFLKNFGRSQLPKDAPERRRERELRVYRDLLASDYLDTARYHGSVWDSSAGRFWLVLEFVDGLPVRDCELDSWVAAAGWLGRMQGYFARHPDRLVRGGFLPRHDTDFFRSKAELAVLAVSQTSAALADRLVTLVSRYDRLVAVMVNQPSTLVHGSYRPGNILVDCQAEPTRVCPVDWELAAIGAPLYDLAFITDGFGAPELDRLWGAYREQAGAWNFPVPDPGEMTDVVNCFRLHKVLKSLSESWEKRYPVGTVAKLVGMAEGLGRLLL
jgi:hypothetical protein